MLKKIIIAISGIFGLLIVSALVAPFLIDVDKFRPEIQQIANDNINGKVEIGKLKLNLWGHLAVEVEGLKVLDKNQRDLLSVKGAYVYFPFMSLVSGNPELKIELIEPDIFVYKDKAGEMNVATLMKPSQGEEEKKPEPEATEKQSDAKLPEIIIKSKSSFAIKKANLSYIDQATNDSYKINNLNVELDKISLSENMSIKIWCDLDTKMGDMVLGGFVAINGGVQTILVDEKISRFKLNLHTEFTDLTVDMKDTFKKEKGLLAEVDLIAEASSSDLALSSLVLKFNDLVLEASGKVNFEPLTYDLNVKQNQIQTDKWLKVLPMLNGLFAQSIGLSWSAAVKTDLLESLKIDIQTKESDIAIVGKVENFSKPSINVAVKSQNLDLDAILPKQLEDPAKDEKSAETATKKRGSSGEDQVVQTPVANVDKDLDGLRNNEFLKGIQATLTVHFKKLTFSSMEITDFVTNANFANLNVKMEPLKLNVFGGSIKSMAELDLKPAQPKYSMGLEVEKINFKQAIESQMPSFANTVEGQLAFKANGGGFSLNADAILKNLILKGSFAITDAKLATVDVSKMVKDGAGEGLESLQKKWPQIPQYKLKSWADSSAGYKEFSSDFTLAQGRFDAPNFKGIPYPEKGFLIEGATNLDLLNDKIEANWNVVDTYNKTGLYDVKLKDKGVEINNLLAEKNQPVRLPIKIGCKLSDPCYKFDSIPSHFAGVAGEKLKKVLGQAVQKELDKVSKESKEKIQKEAKKVESQVKDKAKDLLKGKKLPF